MPAESVIAQLAENFSRSAVCGSCVCIDSGSTAG